MITADVMRGKRTLVILGGGLVQDEKTGVWRTCRFGEGDEYGMTCDRWRVDAALALYHSHLCDRIVASGGAGQLKFKKDPSIPTVGEVIKRELIEGGVPKGVIIDEFGSDNTYQQLINLLNLGNQEIVELYDLALLGQDYRVGRMFATIAAHNQFTVFVGAPILSAEEILLANNEEKWAEQIKESREHPGMKERLLKEYGGIRQIALRTYKFR